VQRCRTPVVTEKGVLVQNADSYFLLVTYFYFFIFDFFFCNFYRAFISLKKFVNENEMKFRSSLHQRHEMKFSEMIDERTSLTEAEMKFNEMKCKRTSPNVREMSQMK
jgi:hypothetical protein